MIRDNTAGIIVLYNPCLDILKHLVTTITPQVETIVLVDNSAEKTDIKSLLADDKIDYIFNDANLGIATSLNIGVEQARKHNAARVILFDQDSIPPDNMVETLSSDLNKLTAKGYKVAGIGPRYTNLITSITEPFYKYPMRLDIGTGVDNTFFSDFMITSGSLLDVAIYEKVGKFEDSLFIDYVDTEWNFRAIKSGFKCFGTESVHMEHCLGDESIKVNRDLTVPKHSSFRVFYQIRNAIILSRRAYMPRKFLIKNAVFHSILYTTYAFRSRDFSYVKSILKGYATALKTLLTNNK